MNNIIEMPSSNSLARKTWLNILFLSARSSRLNAIALVADRSKPKLISNVKYVMKAAAKLITPNLSGPMILETIGTDIKGKT